MQLTTEDIKRFHPDALRMDDFEGRQARAREHVRATSNGVFRRFGFFDKLEHIREYSADELKLVQKVIEIENYAGYVLFEKSSCCLKCRGDCRVGYRDYIFRPLPGGFTYRWPEGLRHYFQYHHVPIQTWMRELVQEFEKARSQGLWR